jgi:hypothetical protein
LKKCTVVLTVEKCHPAVRSHCIAAFGMGDHKQDLVVVCEVERNGYGADLAEVMAAIRRAVSDHRELPVRAIVLTKVGGGSQDAQREVPASLVPAIVSRWPLIARRSH